MSYYYLTPDQIRILHEDAIVTFGGVRGEHEPGMIEYMADKPSLSIFGQEQYPTIFDKAACYWHGFATAQYFVDGNKRTAFMTAKAFLMINGFHLQLEEDRLYHLALRVAKNQIAEPMLARILAVFLQEFADPKDNPNEICEK